MEISVALSGLYVAEAEEVTDEFLDYWKKKQAPEVEIITGAGNHSEGNKAKILPAIKNLVQRRGLKWRWKEDGPPSQNGVSPRGGKKNNFGAIMVELH